MANNQDSTGKAPRQGDFNRLKAATAASIASEFPANNLQVETHQMDDTTVTDIRAVSKSETLHVMLEDAKNGASIQIERTVGGFPMFHTEVLRGHMQDGRLVMNADDRKEDDESLRQSTGNTIESQQVRRAITENRQDFEKINTNLKTPLPKSPIKVAPMKP